MQLEEIQVLLPRDSTGFNLLGDQIHIMDIPGLDDIDYSHRLSKHLILALPRLVPLLVFNLTQGSFEELQHFQNLISMLSKHLKP